MEAKILKRMTVVFVLLYLVCASNSMIAPARAADITAETAYQILHQQGKLVSADIQDRFDLAKLIRKGDESQGVKSIKLQDVRFGGGLEISSATFPWGLEFSECAFGAVRLRDVRWGGTISFVKCEFKDVVDFTKGRFSASFYCLRSNFGKIVRFENSTFNGGVEFIDNRFNGPRTTFAGSSFFQPAHFNHSEFINIFNLNSSLFRDDVSFANCAIGEAFLPNVMFQADAEFRFIKIKQAIFSGPNDVSVFYKVADFRGSEMAHAIFDYSEFRGDTYFVQALFGAKGASFNNVNIYGNITNFDASSSSGPLYLQNSYMPNLRFHWSELGSAILQADPDVDLLAFLHKRLEDLGRADEALDAYYHYRRRVLEHRGRFATSVFDKMWIGIEYILWGWPTGFGTRLGRITGISLFAWILLAIPVGAQNVHLVWIPPRSKLPDERSGILSRRCEPLYFSELPSGACSPLSLGRRIWGSCIFTFALMFKLPLKHIVYAREERSAQRYGLETYCGFVWIIGSILLVLLGLTLANTNPLLKKLIGEIAV